MTNTALRHMFPTLFAGNRCFDFSPPAGWMPLVMRTLAKLEPLAAACEEPKPCVRQVKSKFGGLRLYLSGHTDEMLGIVDAAEAESLVTCETCGEPGISRTRSSGWIETTCRMREER